MLGSGPDGSKCIDEREARKPQKQPFLYYSGGGWEFAPLLALGWGLRRLEFSCNFLKSLDKWDI